MSEVLFEHTHPGEGLPSIALISTCGCLSVVLRGDAPFASIKGTDVALLLTDTQMENFARALNTEMAKRCRLRRDTTPRAIA